MIRVAAIAGAAGIAIGFASAWTVQGWRADAKVSEAERDNRETEQRWADHVIDLGDKANAEADRLRAAAARANDAARSLHDASSRHASAAASAPGTSPAAASALAVHADVLRRLDDATGELARYADAAAAAGRVCERTHEVTR